MNVPSLHAAPIARLVALASILVLASASAQVPCFESCRQIQVGPVNQPEGSGPTALVRADLDGDGRDDLAFPARPHRVEIVWNGPNGLASTTQVVDLPVLGQGLEAADFDGDGDVDLLVLAQVSFSPSLVLLRNSGGRQFGPPEAAGNTGGSSVEVGDVNVDGAPDIVVASASSTTLKVLWNSGTGTFPTQSILDTGTPVGGFALGDLDGDARVDLVLAPYFTDPNGAQESIRVLRNVGGSFVPAQAYAAGVRPWLAESGDVDHDGDLDVVVLDANDAATAGANPGFLRVFVNDGAGNLVQTAAWNTDPSPWAVALGDVDGDQRPELMVACQYGNHLSVAHNLGAGTFANPIVTGAPRYAQALATLDVDHDGRLDLAVASSYDNSLVFLHNEGPLGLRAGEGFPCTPSPSFVTFADVTGDGIDDVITLDRGARVFSVQTLTTTGTSAPVSYPVGPLPNATRPGDMALFDADGDGDTDALVVEETSLALFRNAGNGTFGAPVPYVTGGRPTAVAVGDFDQDGDRDVAFHQETPHKSAVLLNAGNGTFTPGPTLLAGLNMGSLCAGDFNGDGRTDLVLVADSTAFTVAINLGAAQFQLTPFIPTGAVSRRVRCADLDGDADLDLVMASAWFEGVSVVRNNGDATFTPYVGYEVDPIVDDVAVADLDHDGDPDLVFPYLNRLEVMTNDGQGVFSRDDMLGTNTHAMSLAVADVDSDGDVDVAWVDGLTPEIRLQRGCAAAAQVLCAGDGSGTSCPCGNTSAPASGSGCLNSLAVGATLRADGAASLWNDRVTLTGDGMPDGSPVLYLSSPATLNAGLGTAFGDGLRCVGSPITRLGVRTTVNGSSSYPPSAGPSVAWRSGVTTPSVHYYQAWYRDIANFCTPNGFNLTNAVAITWRP